jgi:hypothetical protein
MRIHADRGFTKRISEKNVCSLAADSGQREQIFKLVRHSAAKFLDKNPRAILDGRCLCRKKPVGRISSSSTARSAVAQSRAVLYFLNSMAVTWFTRSSVQRAARMSAINNSNGLE